MPRKSKRKQAPFIPPPGLSPVRRLIAWLEHPRYHFPYEEIDDFWLDEHGNHRKRIVSLGGGPSRNTPQEFNLNIECFEEVDIAADAHCLPFEDNSLDGIHANALLEHVERPEVIVKEVYRVLKPGGMVYTIQPFMHPYHGHPRDYHRFSTDALELLFKDFEPIWVGVNTGPSYALLKSIETYIITYLPLALPFGKKKITTGFQLLFWLLFFWIKYFDCLIYDTGKEHVLANNTLYLGRKPE